MLLEASVLARGKRFFFIVLVIPERAVAISELVAVCGAVGGIVLLVTAVYCMKKKR